MMTFESILAEASQLPVDDRIGLIEALERTVLEAKPPEVSAEWLAEIQRRSEELDAGLVQDIPWEEVQGQIDEFLEAKVQQS